MIKLTFSLSRTTMEGGLQVSLMGQLWLLFRLCGGGGHQVCIVYIMTTFCFSIFSLCYVTIPALSSFNAIPQVQRLNPVNKNLVCYFSYHNIFNIYY